MRTDPSLVLALFLLAGCTAKPGDTGAACDATGVHLTDDANFTFTGTLDVPSVVTASGSDLRVCWDEATEDIQCHGMEPAADIDVVGLIRFSTLTQAEVEAGLSTNDLQQSDMSGYVQFENTSGETCTDLSGMSFFGTQIDVAAEYVEGGGTYLMLLTTGTTPGVGARMISFLEPSAASSETDVSIGTGCGLLDFAVDLHSKPAIPVCADTTAVEWDDLSVDGQGGDVDAAQIDSLMLGYYEGMSVSDLEAGFLDIETSATHLWSLALAGETGADLSLATDSAGATFTGFSGDGTWLLALRCSRCYNPAPLAVVVLDPVDG